MLLCKAWSNPFALTDLTGQQQKAWDSGIKTVFGKKTGALVLSFEL